MSELKAKVEELVAQLEPLFTPQAESLNGRLAMVAIALFVLSRLSIL